jgi:D-glucosaminate-specific PTS system IIC component
VELTNAVASTNILPLAIVGAAMYTVWNQMLLGYTLQGAFQRPIVCAFFFGLVSGRMEECMILGAGIESLYLGLITPGGNVPTDPMAAACVGIPVWLCTSGMTSTAAVALAVPVGLLFAVLTIVKYLICGIFVEPAEKHADDADVKGIFRCTVTYPAIIKAALGFTLMFLSIYLGSSFVQGLLDALPAWLTHGLEVAGGILPALGFALTVMIIGRPTYIPLFLIGYFMVQYGGLSVMACAIFSICIALFITFFRIDVVNQAREGLEDEDDEDEDEAEAEEASRRSSRRSSSRRTSTTSSCVGGGSAR